MTRVCATLMGVPVALSPTIAIPRAITAPLSVADVGVLEYMRRNPGVRWQLSGGQGMNEMLEEHTLERVLRFGRSGTGDEEVESAPIRLNTVMLAEPGKTIS